MQTETMYYNRCRRGAALIWALVAIVVISLLALGVAQLTTARYNTAAQLQGYSRAYYIAESAANWQLARMSRLDQTGTQTTGRLLYADVTGYTNNNQFFTLNTYDNVTILDGDVTMTLTNQTNQTWLPPGDFNLTVIGRDRATQEIRGLYFHGAATGLADRYALYGANGIDFNSAAGVCTLSGGYVGTDGSLTSEGTAPNTAATFGGCRLGPDAKAPSATAFAAWDLPKMPSPVIWPPISEVVRSVWAVTPVSTLQSQNDNAQILFRKADGSYMQFPTPPTQLTKNEFAASTYAPNGIPQRTIKLKVAAPMSNQHNLFYFTDIQMEPNDVLALDLTDATGNLIATAIHIVIDNPNLPEPTIYVTNLAYVGGGANWIDNPFHSYLWFNNTNHPFEYAPTIPGVGAPVTGQDNIATELRGIVYGINDLTSSSNHAGDIVIDGNNGIPVKVDCLIGNNLTLNGNVTVSGHANYEQGLDPNRYVLYYRVVDSLDETDANGITQTRHVPVIDYGRFQ
jgi:Tfp pilus assembly protein PilX